MACPWLFRPKMFQPPTLRKKRGRDFQPAILIALDLSHSRNDLADRCFFPGNTAAPRTPCGFLFTANSQGASFLRLGSNGNGNKFRGASALCGWLRPGTLSSPGVVLGCNDLWLQTSDTNERKGYLQNAIGLIITMALLYDFMPMSESFSRPLRDRNRVGTSPEHPS